MKKIASAPHFSLQKPSSFVISKNGNPILDFQDQDYPWSLKLIYMVILKMEDTIRMGVFAGLKVGECIKQYGKKSLLEVLKYYDLDEELSRKYYHKKEEIQTNEKQEEEYPHLWEGTDRNYHEFFEVYDEMQSSDSYDGVDDEYWYSLYVEGKNPVFWTSDGDEYEPETYNYEPEELSEKQIVREMCNKGYKYWIYG